jgi:hypothetical protein
LAYENTSSVKEPVILNLPTNGVRLRFDGPEQRLRLIEVLDFTKSHLIYKDKDRFTASYRCADSCIVIRIRPCV